MMKEIGSHFWLEPGTRARKCIDTTVFGAAHDDCVFTTSGRGAISQVLLDIAQQEKKALLPAFTCDSVIAPFLAHGYTVSFLDIPCDFRIGTKCFVEAVEKAAPTVILLHNYFGFDTFGRVTEQIAQLRKQGAVVIEDTTQSLYSTFGRLEADYQVGSFRKWAGLPDGGFALKKKGKFLKKPEQYDKQLEEARVAAMQAKFNYLFDGVGEKTAFLSLYTKAEKILEEQNAVYLMSKRAMAEQANLDINALKHRRRENFSYLMHNCTESSIIPAFRELPDDAVPLYFPIFCHADRAQVQTKLRDKDIYAPIIWPKSSHVSIIEKNTEELYNKLLCLPCDQRYSLDDMKRITDCLN